MSVLSWDVPPRAMPVEAWQAISADGAPPGVYSPNMSAADVARWKARRVGFRAGHPQIEIRKDNAVIVVSMGEGYRYKHYTPEQTRGINIHIAAAGPIQWTFADLQALAAAVDEARAVLEQEYTPHV